MAPVRSKTRGRDFLQRSHDGEYQDNSHRSRTFRSRVRWNVSARPRLRRSSIRSVRKCCLIAPAVACNIPKAASPWASRASAASAGSEAPWYVRVRSLLASGPRDCALLPGRSWFGKRRLNGDQSDQARALSLEADRMHTYRVFLFSNERAQHVN